MIILTVLWIYLALSVPMTVYEVQTLRPAVHRLSQRIVGHAALEKEASWVARSCSIFTVL